MNESVLNALIHLFALVAVISRRIDSESCRNIVATFLKRYLTTELLIEYLKVYDNYIDFYTRELRDADPSSYPGQQSLLSFQVTNVCRQIKRGLLRNERMEVFLYLLEFVNEDGKVTREEEEFARTVAQVFNIGESEYNNIYPFIIGKGTERIEKDKLLAIDNELKEWSQELAWFMARNRKYSSKEEMKHIYVENLYGQILFLYVSSIDTFIFKYTGQLNLYLENQKIAPGHSYFMKRGAIIRGPNIRSLYFTEIASRFMEDRLKTPVRLTVENISFRFKNSENGIHPFSFTAGSGDIVGIMGGSGTGKSTLLNILNGKLPPDEGRILINGYDVYRHQKTLEGIIGYIPQEDLLVEELTVYENLYYNARLCFRDFNEQDIKRVTRSMLKDLNLVEVAHLKVGNPLKKFISGGQRKRLNIGLELMREPSVLFVDEPTSGLSSMDSDKVMSLLKNQARKGKLVLVNIHQPSSGIFKMFDQLIILDTGGYPIYVGNPIDAVNYFKKISSQVNAAEGECPTCGNVNPEQILQIIESRTIDDYGNETQERKTKPHEWYREYRERIESKISLPKPAEAPLPESPFSIPGLLEQFRIFFNRNLRTKLADRQYLLINFLEAPLLAIILGYFTKFIEEDIYLFGNNKNIPVFFFMSVVVALFLGLTVSAEEIIRDRKILQRESFLNLSRFSYLNAKIGYLFIVSGIQTLTFVIPAHLILDIHDMWLPFWVILFTTSCFANMLGMNISSAFDSVITIYILIPLIMVPQILFGGAMIHFDDLHPAITNRKYVPVIGDLMTTRWAYEAMAVEQFRNNRFESLFYEADQQISESNYHTAFLLPRLENLVKEILMYHEIDETNEEWIREEINLLRNELFKLSRRTGLEPFLQAEYLQPDLFDASLSERVMDYLYNTKSYYEQLYRKANDVRNQKYDSLTHIYGREGFDTLRLKHHNTYLSDILRNTRQTTKIIQTQGEFVQKMDPVFMMPVSDFGRAHFYAPYKMINGRLIHTLWFNVIFIWFTTSLLYLTLYLDSLRKLVRFLQQI
ncbi:MAG TPA: ATP-binding cassette domain-containing protein [Bacteroidetes bacterium]|nr:ATP-binding cassette domain-containing protein [Bacteroidota bacterium]